MGRFGPTACFAVVAALITFADAGYAADQPVALVVPSTNEPKTLSPDFAADTGGYHPTRLYGDSGNLEEEIR